MITEVVASHQTQYLFTQLLFTWFYHLPLKYIEHPNFPNLLFYLTNCFSWKKAPSALNESFS